MQGAEDEVEGSVLTYVTETEFRKQRSRSPSCNSLKKNSHYQSVSDALIVAIPYKLIVMEWGLFPTST